MNLDEATQYRYFVDQAVITPLVFKDESSNKTYPSFVDCLQEDLLDKIKATPQNYTTVTAFLRSNGVSVLGSLESLFDCGSICQVPLFHLGEQISTHRVTKECFEPALSALK